MSLGTFYGMGVGPGDPCPTGGEHAVEGVGHDALRRTPGAGLSSKALSHCWQVSPRKPLPGGVDSSHTLSPVSP